jgi:hypothetical protein
MRNGGSVDLMRASFECSNTMLRQKLAAQKVDGLLTMIGAPPSIGA